MFSAAEAVGVRISISSRERFCPWANSVSAARAKEVVTSVSTTRIKGAGETVLRSRTAKRDCRMILLSAPGTEGGSIRRVVWVIWPGGRERWVGVPVVKASVEERVVGALGWRVFIRAMPPICSAGEEAVSGVEDSEGDGLGRFVGGVFGGTLSSVGSLEAFGGVLSGYVPRTLFCTKGAMANAVVMRPTCARVNVTLALSRVLPIPAISAVSGCLTGAVSTTKSATFLTTSPIRPFLISLPFKVSDGDDDGEMGGLGCGLDKKTWLLSASMGEK